MLNLSMDKKTYRLEICWIYPWIKKTYRLEICWIYPWIKKSYTQNQL